MNLSYNCLLQVGIKKERKRELLQRAWAISVAAGQNLNTNNLCKVS